MFSKDCLPQALVASRCPGLPNFFFLLYLVQRQTPSQHTGSWEVSGRNARMMGKPRRICPTGPGERWPTDGQRKCHPHLCHQNKGDRAWSLSSQVTVTLVASQASWPSRSMTRLKCRCLHHGAIVRTKKRCQEALRKLSINVSHYWSPRTLFPNKSSCNCL